MAAADQMVAAVVIPRTSAEKVDAMLDAGAEGAVVSFADEAEMRAFANRFLVS